MGYFVMRDGAFLLKLRINQNFQKNITQKYKNIDSTIMLMKSI